MSKVAIVTDSNSGIQQLYIDALTGAYNRRFWEDKMKSFSGIAGIALDRKSVV